jgi:hypothetical protein
MGRPRKVVSTSGKHFYVFSTLTCDQSYATYSIGGGDMAIEEHSVFIEGGFGVANDRFITSLGVCTIVSEEDMAHLNRNPVFKQHKENGYISVQESKADAESVCADLEHGDGSSPMTPSDFTDKAA